MAGANDPHNWLATNKQGHAKDPYGADGANRRGLSTYGGAAAENGDNGYRESSAETAARAYRDQGAQSNNRQGVQINYTGADQNFGNAMESRGLAYGARNSQQDALGLAQSAAYGNQPSQAETLGRNMTDQSLKAQLAGAASARGGVGAQMAAQRQVQQGGAAYRQQGTNQMAALRANEMANARNAYAGQAGAIRQGDQAQGSQDLQAAGQHAQMAQAQGQMDFGQRQLNQGNQQFYDQLGHNVREGEANRGVQLSQQEAQRWAQQTATNQQSKRDKQGLVMDVVDSAGGFLAGLLAKGGPADGGKAYLVGEEGPELIVPREDGYVLTADETKQALSYGGAREEGGPVKGVADAAKKGSVDGAVRGGASTSAERIAKAAQAGSLEGATKGAPTSSAASLAQPQLADTKRDMMRLRGEDRVAPKKKEPAIRQPVSFERGHPALEANATANDAAGDENLSDALKAAPFVPGLGMMMGGAAGLNKLAAVIERERLASRQAPKVEARAGGGPIEGLLDYGNDDGGVQLRTDGSIGGGDVRAASSGTTNQTQGLQGMVGGGGITGGGVDLFKGRDGGGGGGSGRGLSYGGSRAQGGSIDGMLDDRAGLIASQPVDPQMAQMLTDRYEQQQASPMSGVPYWLEKAASDGALSGQPERRWTGQEINDEEFDARPPSLRDYKAKLSDADYNLQYGKSTAPSMGALAAAGKGADAGNKPIAKKPGDKSKGGSWQQSLGRSLKGAT